jgi:plasmid maintenance system antidote protein VapI
MEKVRKLIEVGARPGVAIREILFTDRALTIAGFAMKYELPEKAVSNGINGNVRATEGLCAALANELGGEATEWAALLWEASKPASLVA